jgi:hypothetical protein
MTPRTSQLLLLVVLAYLITMTWQVWLGRPLVYSAAPQKAALVHQAILDNHPPPGNSWEGLGCNGTNVRRVNVELVEALHRATGVPLKEAYFAFDTLFLFASLVLLGLYLARWLEPAWVAIGLLFYGAVGPLTYLFYFFHPWDRLSQLVWLAALWCLRDRKVWPFAALLVFGMAVKYDILPIVALWGAWTWRSDRRLAWALQTAGLAALAIGTLKLLQFAYPGGFDAQSAGAVDHTWLLLRRTLDELMTRGFAFPPLLMFGLPIALAFAGWRHLDRYHRLALLLGCVLFVPLTLGSNLREVRAQVPVLFLVLPAALQTLRRLLTPVTPDQVDGAS